MKQFTDLAAGIASGKPVPAMVKLFAEAERGEDNDPRLEELRVVWRGRAVQ